MRFGNPNLLRLEYILAKISLGLPKPIYERYNLSKSEVDDLFNAMSFDYQYSYGQSGNAKAETGGDAVSPSFRTDKGLAYLGRLYICELRRVPVPPVAAYIYQKYKQSSLAPYLPPSARNFLLISFTG